MTIIQVKTADQVLSAVMVPKLAPHNRNSVKLSVDFDSAWDGYGKAAVFYTENNPTVFEKVLDAEASCLVPPEVLAEPGYMFAVIKGVNTNDNSVKSSARLTLRVSKGSPLFVVSEPTKDVYSQLLGEVGGLIAAIAVERARINNLSALPEGSTAGDAELTDIRVGANGQTYETAGEAVRGQLAEVTKQLEDAEESMTERIQALEEKPAETVGFAAVKSVAHRGYSAEAPENTLSAYRLARKRGFDHAECDVSFTSDGYAVLLHDSTVDRTSDGTGSIADMTLEQVRALDFGSWKSSAYAGEQIPTFEEFIALCKNLGLYPYIELKAGTAAQIQGLVRTVNRYGMKGNVAWISGDSARLGYVKAVDASARLGFVADSITSGTIGTVSDTLKADGNEVFIDCSAANATAEAVLLCSDAGIPLEVWTVNSESDLLALNPYVSGVTSDSLIASQILYNNSIGG